MSSAGGLKKATERSLKEAMRAKGFTSTRLVFRSRMTTELDRRVAFGLRSFAGSVMVEPTVGVVWRELEDKLEQISLGKRVSRLSSTILIQIGYFSSLDTFLSAEISHVGAADRDVELIVQQTLALGEVLWNEYNSTDSLVRAEPPLWSAPERQLKLPIAYAILGDSRRAAETAYDLEDEIGDRVGPWFEMAREVISYVRAECPG